MPDVVGMNLQEAQDLLQSVGSYVMDQQDASGADRAQLIDSNWKVCSQEPAVGADTPLDATVILASVKNDEYCPGEEPVVTEAAPPAETTPAAESATVSQKNAVRKAEDYLNYTAFSRTGLIGQAFEYEGFPTADAEYAVDHVTVDWNEQAASKAADYMDYSSFSRKSLIDQLLYEGFTQAQAEHGADSVGL